MGVIGAGGFGLFALQHFTQIPGVSSSAWPAHIAKPHSPWRSASAFPTSRSRCLLAPAESILIYIATPPFLHHPQGMKALQAGKHVICEKPLAMTVAQADEMIALAQAKASAARSPT